MANEIELAYKDFFEDEGIGTYGDDLFVSSMPESPDDNITLFMQTAPQGTEHQRYDLENTGVKVLIRGSHSFCSSKIVAIQQVTPQMKGTYNGMYIKETLVQTPPTFIEIDDMGRRMYSINYESEYSIGATSRTSVS